MKSPPVAPRCGAFTLLELLVVVAIIGILAGLVYPAVLGALGRAERTHAEQTAQNLKIAISAYATDYRQYPVETGRDEVDEIRSDHGLMDVLFGADHQKLPGGLNPKGQSYFADKPAKPMGGGRFRKGEILGADGSGELWDPWGEYYFVRMDLDQNGRIPKPAWDSSESAMFSESILVWSAGKDTDEASGQDNVKTW